jgi:hypothetical protein
MENISYATCADESETNDSDSGCALLEKYARMRDRHSASNSSRTGDDAMAEQFVNPREQKVQDETDSGKSTEKSIDRIAEKAAEKAAKTQQKNEKNTPIFTE